MLSMVHRVLSGMMNINGNTMLQIPATFPAQPSTPQHTHIEIHKYMEHHGHYTPNDKVSYFLKYCKSTFHFVAFHLWWRCGGQKQT